MRRKLILGIAILAVVAVLVPLSCSEPESESELITKMGSIPALTHLEIRDPDIAPKYGVRGYLEILPAEPPESLFLRRGEEANIPILLHFVSYTPELTEIEVNIDPKHSSLSITKPYSILDAEGKVIKRAAIHVNEIVSYNPSGIVVIKADETLPVTMTVSVPANIPERARLSSIPLGAVGIRADIPTISDIGRLEVIIRD